SISDRSSAADTSRTNGAERSEGARKYSATERAASFANLIGEDSEGNRDERWKLNAPSLVVLPELKCCRTRAAVPAADTASRAGTSNARRVGTHIASRALERESGLQLDHAARESGGRSPKIRIVHVRAWSEESKRRKVAPVERVKHVCPKLERGILSKHVKARQHSSLHQAQIQIGVARTSKTVSPNARRVCTRAGRIEEFRAASRKVSAGSYEGFVAGVVQRSSKVAIGSRRAKRRPARCADTISDQRRPRKPGVR